MTLHEEHALGSLWRNRGAGAVQSRGNRFKGPAVPLSPHDLVGAITRITIIEIFLYRAQCAYDLSFTNVIFISDHVSQATWAWKFPSFGREHEGVMVADFSWIKGSEGFQQFTCTVPRLLLVVIVCSFILRSLLHCFNSAVFAPWDP